MEHGTGGQFRLLGGRLCLDFVNTVGGRIGSGDSGGPPQVSTVLREWLHGYDDLLAWAQQAGIAGEEQAARLLARVRREPDTAAAAFDRAWALREVLYRVFAAAIEGREPEAADLALLNREVADARAHQRLRPGAGGLEWVWDDADPEALDFAVWRVATSAAELLCSPEMKRVRRCGGVECGWLFLDTTRNRSRRWCDMSDCGNAAKVRRFRARQRKMRRGSVPAE